MVPSCSSALWAVKGRHVVGSASRATGSFMESQLARKDGPISSIFREKKTNEWQNKIAFFSQGRRLESALVSSAR